ncbi:MAG TPA: 4-hydroxy-tetrahydrodipicolinate synthase, partial [Rhodobacteraceae bacterium]|nr:4-hydroxy-tetrahydrodipicolinate synthase [Paracoccaceae bacterium]
TLAGDYAQALALSDQLMPLHLAVFREPGVVGVKYAMSRLGLCEPEVRSPMMEATDETKSAIDAAMRVAGLLK